MMDSGGSLLYIVLLGQYIQSPSIHPHSQCYQEDKL